jgi:SsrA-binding protein
MRAVLNKRGLYDYEVLETFEAGVKLAGTEVKSVKDGQINFAGAFVAIRNGEAYLLNATIPAYQPKNAPHGYEPTRERKLLLSKKELSYLAGKAHEKNLTIIPTKAYTVRGNLKIEIAIVRRKKKHDKRELLKKKAHRRDAERELRG